MKSLQSRERQTNSLLSVSRCMLVMLAMVASCVGPTNGDVPVSLQRGKRSGDSEGEVGSRAQVHVASSPGRFFANITAGEKYGLVLIVALF